MATNITIMEKEIFSPEQVISAIETFLECGDKIYNNTGNYGYISEKCGGWAARCLSKYLYDLKNKAAMEERRMGDLLEAIQPFMKVAADTDIINGQCGIGSGLVVNDIRKLRDAVNKFLK